MGKEVLQRPIHAPRAYPWAEVPCFSVPYLKGKSNCKRGGRRGRSENAAKGKSLERKGRNV
jgi:hypothetical protein